MFEIVLGFHIAFTMRDGGDMDYILSMNSRGTHWGLEGAFKVVDCVVWMYFIPGEIETTMWQDLKAWFA